MPDEKQLSEVLSEFARTMVTDFPIQAILNRLVSRIVDIMPVGAAGVTLISPGNEPHYVAASDEAALRFEELQSELHEGPCVLAYRTGDAVTVSDLRLEDRFPNFTPRALDAGLIAVFTFPLRHGDLQLGALDLYRTTPGDLSPTAMTAAQTLADVAAAYLLNAQARDDLSHASERSRERTLHDALTGLPNRILLLERLEHASLRSRRSGKTSAVLFIDLDRFKAVNDTHGHRVGDELLVAVAHRLTGLLRPGDTLARLSGDEFVVLCEELDYPAQAATVGARLGAGLGRPFVLSGLSIEVSASIGIAFADRADHHPGHLLHDADMAMYQAKRQGGARLQVLDLTAQHDADSQVGLERDLRGAAERGEFRVAYQPVVSTVTGRLTGVEALLRWAHPKRGMVPPTMLIPIAEHTGQIAAIGQWVLEQTCADRRIWTGSGQTNNLAVSVNVSAQQLMTAGFAALVATVLDTTETDAGLVTLEVTESVFVGDSERALLVLKDLKDIGVLLALDDFGTGYSSFSYLKRFPLNRIKIDRTFITGLGLDSASDVIVGAIIQLAHGLGMTVVAEGVETVEQHNELTRLGCDSCQGHYFAKPMTATTLDILIHRLATNDLQLPAPTVP